MLKRFLTWKLPLVTALFASLVFASGFILVLRGDVGEAVTAPVAEPRAETLPETLRVVLLGDSLARGTGDESGLGIGGTLDAELDSRKVTRRPTINLAINGARTPDLLRQLESRNVQQIIRESNVVVLSIGGNDLFGGFGRVNAPPENPDAVMDAVLGRIDQIVGRVREANPEARIFLIGLYNPFTESESGGRLGEFVNRWNGKLLERFQSDPDLTVVQTYDLFSHRQRLSLDRFHPGREGYRLIGRRIADSL
ncbi:MAG TPA: GDSL-type esterase/lipase family protein [Thermoanaerobaculia bacterium]|nr:GDSL-type esterase/lipase family protein [Thermoanaerobaculia bacterium]